MGYLFTMSFIDKIEKLTNDGKLIYILNYIEELFAKKVQYEIIKEDFDKKIKMYNYINFSDELILPNNYNEIIDTINDLEFKILFLLKKIENYKNEEIKTMLNQEYNKNIAYITNIYKKEKSIKPIERKLYMKY